MDKKLILGLMFGLFLVTIIPAIDALTLSIDQPLSGDIIWSNATLYNITVTISDVKAQENVTNVTCKYRRIDETSYTYDANLVSDETAAADANKTSWILGMNTTYLADGKIDILCIAYGANGTTAQNSKTDVVFNNTALVTSITSPANDVDNLADFENN